MRREKEKVSESFLEEKAFEVSLEGLLGLGQMEGTEPGLQGGGNEDRGEKSGGTCARQ